MSKRQKTICFIAYHWPHVKLFRTINSALPGEVDGQLKLVHALVPASVLQSSAPPQDVPESHFSDLTVPYMLKKLCNNPELDTEQWRNRLKHRAIQWYKLFLKELEDVDLIVTWNGLGIPLGAAATAARQLGKRIAVCDNGVLPGTVAIDAKGVNYNGSLTGKDAAFYRSFPSDEGEIDDLWQTVWPQRPLRIAVTKKDDVDLQEDKPLPSRYVLYAMQVQQDSQIQLFSPRFHSMQESVSYVYEQLKEYNRSTGDNLSLVVKEHPSDYGQVDYTELRASMPDVRFIRSIPIRDLIKSAAMVVTINSSVGVESLFSGLPVVTLGQAFYNVPGLVQHIEQGGKELSEVMPFLLSTPVDNDLRRSFLYFLWKQYLVPRPERDTSGATRCAERLIDILEGRLAW